MLLAVVALNVTLNFLLVPRFGIIASAWITVGSYIFTAAFYVFYTKQQVGYKLFQYAWWPLAASLVSGLVLLQLRGLYFVWSGLIVTAVYFAILFGFGFLKKNDLLFLRSIFSRE